MTLIEHLYEVKDFRRKQGQRFPLPSVLLIIIMGTMSGFIGYRELYSFAKANEKELVARLKIKNRKIPSHVTIREIITKMDFESFNQAFTRWASSLIKVEKNEWFSIDGKAIKSTVTDYLKSYQNFISIVSVFTQKRGQVLMAERFENKKKSEISVVRDMLEKLDIKESVITLDALHCKKKH